ncbi:potassium-transporting ATPase subunit KdpA [Sediminibacterium sp.]|mgnify:CR=1 FL=1|uniref:potassium-transporting ATPase subunit KdpA n=1 Tax=Sediminibacterium sp. TaxID=1917865 RepID=UPI003F69D14D
MYSEMIGIVFMFTISLLLAIPLGKYMAKVYGGQPTRLNRVFNPLEKWLFGISNINPNTEMNWKQHMLAMMIINGVWIVLGMLILMNQSWLPLNPDKNPDMSAHLAFNTTISFVVNCNLQHYSGETGVSYLSQLFLQFLQFVSAATGMAAAVVLFKALKDRATHQLGNFYFFFVKSITRILLPISVVIAILFLLEGMPMSFEGKEQMVNLQGDTIQVSRGPVASFVPIKHLGTNGGGYFGSNSAHPLENPSYFSNMVAMIAQLLIPFSMIFAFGYFINRRKMSWMIFGVMTVGFLLLAIPNIVQEVNGNPAIAKMGIQQKLGAMEGKEMRIGAAASGFWSIVTTVISTGSVNAMHDSTMPMSGMNEMLAMMVNSFYGGCGVGLLNFFIFIILAVFISGLMVGRTPEFLGKKIEANEIKIAMLIALLHPFLILVGTALSSYLYVNNPEAYASWLNNPGFHGFSEMLYEYTSSAANNGSGFEGLGDNTLWWNTSTGIVLILGRFLPIIGPVAIAGMLAAKKQIPESAGTLKTDTTTFGIMIFAVILIVTALSFFPSLALGPIAEYFTLY